MGKRVFFSRLVTKDLTAVDSSRRLFEGVLTVEMKDRQNEITIRDELLKVLPLWMARGAPITDTHSNRVVGKGINFAATDVTDADGHVYPAITIQGEIFKDYELDNEIWSAIKSGKYKGLSFGGATKSNRSPVQQSDGTIAYSLKDLEHYEVAVCEEPAVPLALITRHNELAKSIAGKTEDRGNGMMCIRCTKFGCFVDKNGEDFSDTRGPNKPNEDEQAEALENNRGEPQENGSTYHGTDKGRHSKDDGVYSRTEQLGIDESPATPKLKAQDEDNKEMLDRADLEEEKKLEHAKDESEGPVQANKVLPALLAGAGRAVASAGKEIADEGASLAGTAAGSAANEMDDTCKSGEPKPSTRNIFDEHHATMSGKVPRSSVGVNTTFMKPEEARQHQRNHIAPEVANTLKANLDLINMNLRLKSDYNTDHVVREYDSESKKKREIDKKRDVKQEQHLQRHGHYPKMRTTYNPLRREQMQEECINCKKIGDDRAGRAKKPSVASLEAQSPITELPKPRALGENEKFKGGEYTDSKTWTEPARGGFAGREPGVTRDDESRAISDVNQPKHVNKPVDEEGAEGVKKKNPFDSHEARAALRRVGRGLRNNDMEEVSGRLREPIKVTGNVCGKDEITPETLTEKAFLYDKGEYITKPFGGYKDFADCVARNKDKGDPEAYCGQIKHQVEKEARDPQLQANNSEDGVNGKMRTNNDEEAEAFEKKSEKVIDAKKRPQQVISPEASAVDSYKSTNINDPGMGSGGVRNGGAYDNAQQDTSQKDQPRKVIEEEYTGEKDSDNGGDNEEYKKAILMINNVNLKAKLGII